MKKRGDTAMTLNSTRYILRETFNSMKRNPWLSMASVLTVMVSLVILGFSVFFLANASNMAKSFESQVEIATFVQNGTNISCHFAQKSQSPPGIQTISPYLKRLLEKIQKIPRSQGTP